METALDFVRTALGGFVAALGFVCVLGGSIGLLRFPDLYTRLHAARVGDGLGAVLVLIGLAILSGDIVIGMRLLLLAALAAAVTPLLSHLAANAAHTGGLSPLAGRYTAPRPGAKRPDA